MRRATFLASARSDFLAIRKYVAETTDDVVLALRIVNSLRDQCHRLAGLPGTLGRARPELLPDIRSAPFKGYLIFFRYVGDRFEIVSVLHGSRDISTHWANDA